MIIQVVHYRGLDPFYNKQTNKTPEQLHPCCSSWLANMLCLHTGRYKYLRKQQDRFCTFLGRKYCKEETVLEEDVSGGPLHLLLTAVVLPDPLLPFSSSSLSTSSFTFSVSHLLSSFSQLPFVLSLPFRAPFHFPSASVLGSPYFTAF